MIDDPSRSTVVAWYETLPDELALLVERVQVGACRLLGDTFTPRDPTQVHATLIGLESAPAPFDPAPLAAHLREALSPPWTIRFGGFSPGDRRWRSRGLPLHSGWSACTAARSCSSAGPSSAVSRSASSPSCGCAVPSSASPTATATIPDVYLVLGEVTGAPTARVASVLRHELAAAPVFVPLSMADLSLVTYDDNTLPRTSTTWCPL